MICYLKNNWFSSEAYGISTIPSTIRSIRYCVLRNSISALLWHSHTITLYPKGNNVDSIDEIIEVQNVESSIGSRMATENDLALRSPLAILFGWKSSSLIASSIARRVLSFTVLPLMYLETVPTESPARAATSRIVEAIITPSFLMWLYYKNISISAGIIQRC